MGRIEEIEQELQALNQELEKVTGTRTEVYSRIVGYYRSLNNWNLGKSEEYARRVTFGVPEKQSAFRSSSKTHTSRIEEATGEPVRYELFTRETCPNCPVMKRAMTESQLPGVEIDADTEAGIQRAIELSIYATPTVVFFDKNDSEVTRSSSPAELRSLPFAVAV